MSSMQVSKRDYESGQLTTTKVMCIHEMTAVNVCTDYYWRMYGTGEKIKDDNIHSYFVQLLQRDEQWGQNDETIHIK